MKQKLFFILTLLLCVCSGAWADETFTFAWTTAGTQGYCYSQAGPTGGALINNNAIYFMSSASSQPAVQEISSNKYLNLQKIGFVFRPSSDVKLSINAAGNNTSRNLTISIDEVYEQVYNAFVGCAGTNTRMPAKILDLCSSDEEKAWWKDHTNGKVIKLSSESYVAGTDGASIQCLSGETSPSASGYDLGTREEGTKTCTWTTANTFDDFSIKLGESEYVFKAGKYYRVYVLANNNSGLALNSFTFTATKTTPTLTLGTGSGSADIADGRTAFALPALTSSPNETDITDNITYSSSDESVATINSTTGDITLKKAGTTTITASFAGNGSYNEASVDYELTVTNSTDFEADLRTKSSGSYGIAANGDEVAVDADNAVITLTGTYKDNQHGWNAGSVITVPVTGPTKITLGTCQYGNGAVTVKNSSEETVLSFSTNDVTCYHNNTTDNVVTRYYEGGATTLTITVNNYLPYIKVSAVGEDQIEYAVTFDISGAGADAASTAPAAAVVTKGGDYTIPANYSVYKSGYTLTGWNDGSSDHNIGSNIENITGNITLTPVFRGNAKEISGRTGEVKAIWNFGIGNGAPELNFYNTTGIYVVQADVDGKSIDVKMAVDATDKLDGEIYNAMLRNTGRSDKWAEIVNGLKLTVPSTAGATVSMEAYGNISTSTIDGSTTYEGTGTTTVSKEITSSSATIDIVLLDGGNYYSNVTVTYPSRQLTTPTISPADGATFSTAEQEITITADEGATIYYTLDGTTPTSSSSAEYDSEDKPSITSTTTVKAIAIKDGYIDSEVASATITKTVSATVASWDFTDEISEMIEEYERSEEHTSELQSLAARPRRVSRTIQRLGINTKKQEVMV